MKNSPHPGRFISLSNEMKVYVHAKKSQEQAKSQPTLLRM